jgi:hypothetical protein
VADHDAARRQHLLDHAQAEREAEGAKPDLNSADAQLVEIRLINQLWRQL